MGVRSRLSFIDGSAVVEENDNHAYMQCVIVLSLLDLEG